MSTAAMMGRWFCVRMRGGFFFHPRLRVSIPAQTIGTAIAILDAEYQESQ